jgi:DNA mismatch repair ATPase MutS
MRQVKVVTFGVGLRSNPVLGILFNLILPWDFLFAYLADRYRAQVAQAFPTWAEICYRLDALIALANFGFLNPSYVFPEIALDAKPVLGAEDLGHPLIPHDRQVHNDFLIDAPGALAIITGSNMAGKSTFVKTIGINLCLAYAGAPVDATQFRSVPFRLHTCIRITDSIVDGFSYFYAEVKCLKRLLEELKSDGGLPLLYLIDEIFRGTNNRERLLGSRAYIRALLGENAAGLLATHDLELASLAESSPKVHNYHFRDSVRDGRLVFDYKIQPGPCPTTNALKIMQMEGLPVDSD